MQIVRMTSNLLIRMRAMELTELKRSSIMASMNRLTNPQRAHVLHLLCEGNSIRAVTRLTGISKTTVSKLVVDAGQACFWYQERVLRNLPCKRVEVDEIWGFVGAKTKNAKPELKETGEQGDAWLWVATCADTKIVPCWLVGTRDAETASDFIADLAERLSNRIQLTSDGHKPYLQAVEDAFGDDVDFAQPSSLRCLVHLPRAPKAAIAQPSAQASKRPR